ncbi:MAG TPA: MFS transporter [Xanthobacteraceae bacterium]|nr:MFS transporter [Xanthobacteraceae bacterium]
MRRVLLSLTLLWLAGAGLRLTVLAVPPVLPLIHADLNLSETEVGILTGLPALLFALAAVPGSLLIARLGPVTALAIGLLLDGVASGLRGAAPSALWLYAATIAMGAGIAIAQPAMPPVARAWLPDRIGFATAVYTNGFLLGATAAAALSLPLVLPFVGGSWRLGFAAWAAPVIMTAVLVPLLAPRVGRSSAHALTIPRWWPDWRSPLLWRLGLLFGSNNSTYFTTNAFLSDYLNAHGAADLIGPALTALNVGQIPISFALIAAAGRLQNRLWPYVVSGLGVLAGLAAIVFGTGAVVIAGAALVGLALTLTFVLILALPPMLSAPGDVHRMAAGMFTISYSTAVLVPAASGLLWDLTGVPGAAFAPIAVCAVLIAALAPGLPIGRRSVLGA